MTPTMQLFTSGSQVFDWCLPGADGHLRGTSQDQDAEPERRKGRGSLLFPTSVTSLLNLLL